MTGARTPTQRHEHPDAPRVSVIIPFFNAEQFLAEAIDSVLGQEFHDFELVLVDDGSTDRSTQIARDCSHANPQQVRYLEHPGHANRGTTAARNLGIRETRGDLVAFLDADDRWRPPKLKEQVGLLDRMPEVDAVCGSVNFWASPEGGEDQIIATGHVRNRPVAPPEALLEVYPLGRADPPCPSDLIIRRSMLERIGGFEESFTGPLQLYEDQAFLAKLYLDGTIYFSDRVWLDYRLHDQSCTARVAKEGLGPDMRRHCLEWFEAYLAGTRHRYNLAIRWALIRALRPYRHPHISRAGRLIKGLLRGKSGSPACT